MTEQHGRDDRPARRTRRPWRRAAIAGIAGVTAAALLAGPGAIGPAAAQDAGGPSFDVPERQPYEHDRLAPTLRDDLEGAESARGGRTARGALPPVEVVVESTDVAASRAAIEAAGGRVTDAVADRIQAEVPAAALGRLADDDSSSLVREPYPMQTQALSEGVAESGANVWHTGGQTGAGQLVAVVDLGFAGYASLLGSELPASVDTDFSRCEGNANLQPTDHGTAVAEIVHDEAPGAALLLVCVSNDLEFASALGTLAAKGVDVVNGSIGVVLSGRGDGSGGPGTAAGAVAALRRQDVLFVAAAGNYGQTHKHFNTPGDNDLDGYDDFVDIGPDDVVRFGVAPGGVVLVSVKWDQWPIATTDFDIYIGNDECGVVGGSEANQTEESLPPIEAAVIQSCSGSFSTFELVVNRYSGSGSPRMDVFLDGDVTAFVDPTASSLPEPATSPAALTVGAYCWSNDQIRTYSGAGPTIDERIKPDLSAADAVSTTTYGGAAGCNSAFQGTSASAPHVAGAAALIRAANPQLDVAEVQQLLEDRAIDIASPGKDILTGSGRLTLGASGSAPPPVPYRLTPVTPTRLLDTRAQFQGVVESVFGPSGQTLPIGPNAQLALPVANVAGIPADATAVVLNVTVTEPTQSGWVTVYPGGPVPNASNVNFSPGQTTAVSVTATVGSDDKVRIYNARGSSHVVVDITGWYGPTGTDNGLVTLANPARAFDSRPGTLGYAEPAFGQNGRTTPIGPAGKVDIQVAGLGGVPQGASAVLVNLTATGPTGSGWFTMFPTGATQPTASTLNFRPGLTVANLAVMPVGTDGKVSVFNSHGNTDAVLDVVGYYQAGTGSGYVALDPPTRSLDSRNGNGPRFGALGANGTYRLESGRYYGVPWRATAVLLNLTAVFPTQSGWFTAYPGTASLPLASNLNFDPGTVVPNAVVSRLGTDCTVAINNARGSTHVVADVNGYFAIPGQTPPPKGTCGPTG